MAPARWLAAMAVLCFVLVGVALVSQHVYGMQPCPWCILQRLIFLGIGLLALLGALAGAALLRTLLVFVMLLLALCGSAAALYQHFVAARSLSCNMTLADRIVSGLGLDRLLPPVFQVTASCADAAVNLAGLPYEFWSLGFYLLLILAALGALRAARR
jgi:disulfide bond formation protein DsbB